MSSTEYRALIERMGPQESIIDHLGNILDLLLPAVVMEFFTSALVSGRTVKNSERRSRNG